MSNKQETIADIVAEMRKEGHSGDASCLEWVECDKSYKRYVHEGTEHKCFYELKNDKATLERS